MLSDGSFFRAASVPNVFTEAALKKEYGALAGLVGKWTGDKGWNFVTLPKKDGGKEDFTILVQPYTENIEFSLVPGAVPNRSTNGPQFNYAVKYDLSIRDRVTKGGLHAENGMFIRQANNAKHAITRQAIVPHGNSILAIGDAVLSNGNPIANNLDELDKIFSIVPTPVKGQPSFGYAEGVPGAALLPLEELAKKDPTIVNGLNPAKIITSSLWKDTQGQKILKSITIDLDTKTDGGIVNTPFLVNNANTPDFRSIFWIQKVKGSKVTQLQYAQVTNIQFPVSGDLIINWPHINVNTLHKIE